MQEVGAAVETEFHSQSLAAHSSLHRGAHDLVAAAGEGESVVVANHAIFDVTEDGGQIHLRG